MADYIPALSRFMSKIHDDGGCWMWTTTCNHRGYGMFWYAGKTVTAHRFSYEHHVGPVPEGLQLDHLCRNRRCANPDHLEPVTQQENLKRGVGVAAINSKKTECPKGHPYSGSNLVINAQGRRVCRVCINRCSREYQRNRRTLSD